MADWRDLLTDPQTSGGLLIAVAEADAGRVLDMAVQDGFTTAAEIGRVVPAASRPSVIVRA